MRQGAHSCSIPPSIRSALTYNWRALPQETSQPYLSIVIPALNEAGRLPSSLQRLYDYLCRQDYRWEIIVVSNGSTDDTDAVVHEAAKRIPNLRLLSLRQRGKGVASRFGAFQSHGDVIFLCDADLSMPPENLARFLDLVADADIVVGSREATGARRYNEPAY